MIHTSLSPNTEKDDLWLAFKQFLPWNWFSWKQGKEIKHLEKAFAQYLGVDNAFSVQRGRDALYLLLKSMGISFEDEVILQAYTCIVVPNAIQYTGAKPIYVDIEQQGFNIDPKAIEKAITEKTKAVVIQHTFGEPADIEAIQQICKKHQLLLIEDCAHALSGEYKGQKLGTFGDAAIWSFGRDKIISSVWGGMVTTNSPKLAGRLKKLRERLPYPSLIQIKQALIHPLLFALIKPVYHSKAGKGLLVVFQKIRLLPRVIFPLEKKGKRPTFIPQRMPNVLALLALHQLRKLERFHRQRTQLAELYRNALENNPNITIPPVRLGSKPAWLRYTIRTADAGKLINKARRKGIYLGDWYRSVLAPAGCNLKDFQYQPGSCPRAEKAASETLNLPTHIQMSLHQQQEIVELMGAQS